MSGDIPPFPNMSSRHAQGQSLFHLQYLLQYYTNSGESELLEMSLKLVTGVETSLPPGAQTSQHKFPDWRSTVEFWGVLGLILD